MVDFRSHCPKRVAHWTRWQPCAGPNEWGLDLYDRPNEVAAILDELTDLWIGVCEAVRPWIPSFHGGYCSRMKMFAPDYAVTPQNDISSIISAEMYKEFALPSDRRIISHFPYHSFHTHDTEYHQIENLLELEELTVIQIFLQPDMGGPPFERILPVIEQALERKPVLLGAENLETAERCLESFSSTGLFLMLETQPLEPIPESHKQWLLNHCLY